jgi:hypothetical protein
MTKHEEAAKFVTIQETATVIGKQGKEVKYRKKPDMVKWADEIEPLVVQLLGQDYAPNKLRDLSIQIGYSHSGLPQGKRNGEIRNTVRLALLGLMAEKKLENTPGLHLSSFDEITALFDACRMAMKALPSRADIYRKMLAQLSQEMVRLAK